MVALARIVTLLLAFVALVACALTTYEWIVPPFTDDEIGSAFIDTWEPYAWFTMFLLVVLGVIAASNSLVVALIRDRAACTTAIVGLVLSVGGALIAYRNHAEVTERTTALTGQTFGRFNGLF